MSTLNKQERTGVGLAVGSVLLVGGSVAASSMLAGYPVLGGQAVRYLAAGLLLAAWARLTHQPLPRPAGRDWAWLAALAIVGLAGCSVLMIQATRVADPASVGVFIGAAPLVIIIAAAITARRRPTRRVLLAAAIVTAGSAAAQLGGATGPAFSPVGLLWSTGALVGVVGTSLLAAPILPRLGALAVTVYACALAGLLLLAAAVIARTAGGPPILRVPSPAQLAALAYLTIAVTALVFLAWYGALQRLGVDRTGLFNGLVPVTSLAAVALTGTGTITPFGLLGALAVLVGVILGLSRRKAHAGCAARCRMLPSASTSPSGHRHCTRPPSNCSWYSSAYSPPCPSNSWCDPDSTTRPPSITLITSALTIVDSRCAIAIVVRDPISASSAFCTSRSLAVSSADVASSRIRIRGSWSSTRAMASRCFSPPDSRYPRSPTTVS
jgi:drug/metabolite transporter (DMT)-like permease